MEGKLFYKVLCEEVDVFEKQIHEDVNRGSIDEVCDFIKDKYNKYPMGTWSIIPMVVK